MKAALKHQARYMGAQWLLCAAVLLAEIFYIYLSSSGPFYELAMRLSSRIMVLMFSLLMFVFYIPQHSSMALCFGATRRAWFAATVATQLLFAAALPAFGLLVAEPLGAALFGNGAAWQLELYPLLFTACLLLATLGCFMGYLGILYGAKWVVITVGASVLLGLGGFLGGALLWDSFLDAFAFSALGPLVLLALCLPLQWVSWRMVRRMQIKG